MICHSNLLRNRFLNLRRSVKKSALTSPTHTDSNISKTSSYYKTATSILVSNQHLNTLKVAILAEQWMLITNRQLPLSQQPAAKLLEGGKFTIREEDREDIAERVRSKINANPEENSPSVYVHILRMIWQSLSNK